MEIDSFVRVVARLLKHSFRPALALCLLWRIYADVDDASCSSRFYLWALHLLVAVVILLADPDHPPPFSMRALIAVFSLFSSLGTGIVFLLGVVCGQGNPHCVSWSLHPLTNLALLVATLVCAVWFVHEITSLPSLSTEDAQKQKQLEELLDAAVKVAGEEHVETIRRLTLDLGHRFPLEGLRRHVVSASQSARNGRLSASQKHEVVASFLQEALNAVEGHKRYWDIRQQSSPRPT